MRAEVLGKKQLDKLATEQGDTYKQRDAQHQTQLCFALLLQRKEQRDEQQERTHVQRERLVMCVLEVIGKIGKERREGSIELNVIAAALRLEVLKQHELDGLVFGSQRQEQPQRKPGEQRLEVLVLGEDEIQQETSHGGDEKNTRPKELRVHHIHEHREVMPHTLFAFADVVHRQEQERLCGNRQTTSIPKRQQGKTESRCIFEPQLRVLQHSMQQGKSTQVSHHMHNDDIADIGSKGWQGSIPEILQVELRAIASPQLLVEMPRYHFVGGSKAVTRPCQEAKGRHHAV